MSQEVRNKNFCKNGSKLYMEDSKVHEEESSLIL